MTEVGEKKCRYCAKPAAKDRSTCYRKACRRKQEPWWDEPSSFKYEGDPARWRTCTFCDQRFQTQDFSARFCQQRCRTLASQKVHELGGGAGNGLFTKEERARWQANLRPLDNRKRHKRRDGTEGIAPWHGWDMTVGEKP
jgi:hypothetical protein